MTVDGKVTVLSIWAPHKWLRTQRTGAHHYCPFWHRDGIILVLNVDMDSLVQVLNLSFVVGHIYICPCVYCEYIFLQKNKTNKKRPRKILLLKLKCAVFVSLTEKVFYIDIVVVLLLLFLFFCVVFCLFAVFVCFCFFLTFFLSFCVCVCVCVCVCGLFVKVLIDYITA